VELLAAGGRWWLVSWLGPRFPLCWSLAPARLCVSAEVAITGEGGGSYHASDFVAEELDDPLSMEARQIHDGQTTCDPSGQEVRIVLSVLAGEVTIAEAAKRQKISEQSIGRWTAEFLEAGKQGLIAGKRGPTTRKQQLEAEVADLTQARSLHWARHFGLCEGCANRGPGVCLCRSARFEAHPPKRQAKVRFLPGAPISLR
jgi:transposase